LDNTVQDASLNELQLAVTVLMEADTRRLFGITYNSFIFANDEIKVATNTAGLLESVSATTEDRISNIIAQISQAPKDLLSKAFDPDLAPSLAGQPSSTITQSVTFTNNFYILPSELEANGFKRKWIIPIDGADPNILVNASFKCTYNAKRFNASAVEGPFNGLVTRPLRKLLLQVHQATDTKKNIDNLNDNSAFSNEIKVSYEVMVPDTSLALEVPIRRAAFVKKINTPKFSNGILIENYISKPSQMEAFLSIPINVLKAVFAIPSQLLSFKISHIQQETALETAQQALLKAQQQTKAAENASNAQINKINQASINAQQTVLSAQQSVESTKAELQGLIQQAGNIQGQAADPQAKLNLQANMGAIEKLPGFQGIGPGALITLLFTNDPIQQSTITTLDGFLGKGNYLIQQSGNIETHGN
jgi:hypothetical protein